MKYQILEHKADLKIKALGRTKEELFQSALFGVASILLPEYKIEKVKRKIIIKSLDFSALLVDFLSEALYLTQINKEIYDKVKFTKFTDTELKAELSGQKIEKFGEEIKAVTHHNLNVVKNKKGLWQAIILFDI